MLIKKSILKFGWLLFMLSLMFSFDAYAGWWRPECNPTEELRARSNSDDQKLACIAECIQILTTRYPDVSTQFIREYCENFYSPQPGDFPPE